MCSHDHDERKQRLDGLVSPLHKHLLRHFCECVSVEQCKSFVEKKLAICQQSVKNTPHSMCWLGVLHEFHLCVSGRVSAGEEEMEIDFFCTIFCWARRCGWWWSKLDINLVFFLLLLACLLLALYLEWMHAQHVCSCWAVCNIYFCCHIIIFIMPSAIYIVAMFRFSRGGAQCRCAVLYIYLEIYYLISNGFFSSYTLSLLFYRLLS